MRHSLRYRLRNPGRHPLSADRQEARWLHVDPRHCQDSLISSRNALGVLQMLDTYRLSRCSSHQLGERTGELWYVNPLAWNAASHLQLGQLLCLASAVELLTRQKQ